MAEQAQNYTSAAGGQTAESVSKDSIPSGTDHVSHETRNTGSRREQMRSSRAGNRLQDATREAARSLKEPAGGKIGGDSVTPAADGQAEQKPWEAPKWATLWREQQKESRLKALQALSTNPDLAEHWKELDSGLNEYHQWDAQRNWQIGQYRQRFDPIAPLINHMAQQYTRQGMSLEQGLGQLWQTAQDLATDPDSTIARLGQWYKPRNAAQVLPLLAQAWGVDLGQVAQGQPYVDPMIAKELQAVKSALQQSQEQNWQRQQAERQQQYNALIQHITEFETAKDASGTLKHPYAQEVGQEMGILLNMGKARDLEQAYEMATKYHPKAQEERQKQAEKKAREDAARNTTDAEQARSAARNVNGRPGGRESRVVSMDDAIRRAEKSTFGRT